MTNMNRENPSLPDGSPSRPGDSTQTYSAHVGNGGNAADAARQGAPSVPAAKVNEGVHSATSARQRKRLILGVVAGGAALVATAGVIVAVVTSSVSAYSEQSEEDYVASIGNPAKTVEAYLQALADSDAESALELLTDTAGDEALLTDEVLEASNTLAPLQNIKVEAVDDPTGYDDVFATFSLGDESVTKTFTVTDDNGLARIADGLSELTVPSRLDGFAVKINDVAVTEDTVTVFPGTYQIASAVKNFDLVGTTATPVTERTDYSAFSEVTIELNDAGKAIFQQAISESVNACLASKNLSAGCGLDVPKTLTDGTVLIDGTVTRAPSAEAQAAIANLTPETSYSGPLHVSSQYLGSVTTTAECEKDGRRTACEVLFGPGLKSALVDFSQDPVVVRWD